jgi:hypothetical protein
LKRASGKEQLKLKQSSTLCRKGRRGMKVSQVVPMVSQANRAPGVGKSSGHKMHSSVLEENVIYVDIPAVVGAGVLDIKLQESWVDEDAKYVDSGVAVAGVGVGIHFLEPMSGTHGRGLYYRVVYEVKVANVTFGAFMVRREEQ